jgi:hypothetical protein
MVEPAGDFSEVGTPRGTLLAANAAVRLNYFFRSIVLRVAYLHGEAVTIFSFLRASPVNRRSQCGLPTT